MIISTILAPHPDSKTSFIFLKIVQPLDSKLWNRIWNFDLKNLRRKDGGRGRFKKILKIKETEKGKFKNTRSIRKNWKKKGNQFYLLNLIIQITSEAVVRQKVMIKIDEERVGTTIEKSEGERDKTTLRMMNSRIF